MPEVFLFTRSHLNLVYDYILLCQNEKRILKLRNNFRRTDQYFHSTRYYESVKANNDVKFTLQKQIKLSEYQKIASHNPKIHYQKHITESVADTAKKYLSKSADVSTA